MMLSSIGELLKSVSEIARKAIEGEKEPAAEDLYVGPEMAEGGIATEAVENRSDSIEIASSEITSESNTTDIDASNSFEKMTDALHQVSTAIHRQAETAMHHIGANPSTDGSSIGKTTKPEAVMHENVHIDQNYATTDETHMISIEDAITMLNDARTSLNESGIESDLRDILNHPDASAMLENLKEAGIGPLTVSGPEIEGQSPQDQILSVIEAAQDATYEHGVEIPQAKRDMPEVMQNSTSTSFEDEYTRANEDYGIV